MARSKRKTSIVGVTATRSAKPFKVDEHRSERRTVRDVLNKTRDGDAEALHSRPYGKPDFGPKDGKTKCDSEFRIGVEFWCGDKQRRCTDVGSRVIVAICLSVPNGESILTHR